MTREECIGLLERYAEYHGMGIPNLAGCREAMKMAAELLSTTSFPSNLDEAAIDAAQLDMQDRQIMEATNDERLRYSRIFRRGFKAGAEWMAGQGISADAGVCKLTERAWVTPINEKQLQRDLYDNFIAGEKVIIQIRKK